MLGNFCTLKFVLKHFHRNNLLPLWCAYSFIRLIFVAAINYENIFTMIVSRFMEYQSLWYRIFYSQIFDLSRSKISHHVLSDNKGGTVIDYRVCHLQAVKRLMTFAQRKFPTDPSKCVEYKGIKT